MTKRQIKLLNKLEKELENELNSMYIEAILQLYPMTDIKESRRPNKRAVIKVIENKMNSDGNKLLSVFIMKFVNRKYEAVYVNSTL